jgi:tripartite-type tricarboxylate transporter receptor subunit TctC
MNLTSRRKLLTLLLTLVSPVLLAQDAFPSRPVKIIVPFAVGGGVNTMVEIMRAAITRELGQPLVAEYRPGAAGMVGVQALLNAPADGYTLLLHSTSLASGQAINPTPGFDARTDLKPISNLAFSSFALVVSKNVPAKTLPELVAYANANPGKLNYASTGIGGSTHLAAELMKQALGNIPIVHIPYKASGAVITAIASGEIDMTMEFPNNVKAHVDAGSGRFLAIAAKQRDPLIPDVPIFSEAGFPAVEIGAWLALFGPAKLADPIADKLQAAFAKAAKDPQVVERFRQVGYSSIGSTREQLAQQLSADTIRYTALVKSANIKAQ